MISVISSLLELLVVVIGLLAAFIAIHGFIKHEPLFREVVDDRASLLNSQERRRALTRRFIKRYLVVDSSIFGERIFSLKALYRSMLVTLLLTALSLCILYFAPTEYPFTPTTIIIPALSIHGLPILVCVVVSTLVTDFFSIAKSRALIRLATNRKGTFLNARSGHPQDSAGQNTKSSAPHAHIPVWIVIGILAVDILATITIFVIGFSIVTRLLIGFLSLFFLGGLPVNEFFSSFSRILAEYSLGLQYLSGEILRVPLILFLETPEGQAVWPTIRLFTFVSFTLWPVFFLSTFATLILVTAYSLTSLSVRFLVVNSALAGKFLKKRVDFPNTVFKDWAILSLVIVAWAIFRGIQGGG